MQNQRLFSKLWLALGFMQLVLLQGCVSGGANDHMFSSTGPAEESEASAAGESAASRSQVPVRLQRTFFERSLAGDVRIIPAAAADRPVEKSSDVAWHELPSPYASTSSPDVIANFKDHQGCATLSQLGGAQLCFQITADVTSVGVNADEISAPGLAEAAAALLAQAHPDLCQSGELSNLAFSTASKTENGVTVHFTGQCDANPVAVALTLRQL